MPQQHCWECFSYLQSKIRVKKLCWQAAKLCFGEAYLYRQSWSWTAAEDVSPYPPRLMDGTEVFLSHNSNKVLKNITATGVDRCHSVYSSVFGQGDGLPSFHIMSMPHPAAQRAGKMIISFGVRRTVLWVSHFCTICFVCVKQEIPPAPPSDYILVSPVLVSGSFYLNCCKVPSYLNWLLWSCIWMPRTEETILCRNTNLRASNCWFHTDFPAIGKQTWFLTWALPVTKFARTGSRSWIMWEYLVRGIRVH